jgi:hypothetical protein
MIAVLPGCSDEETPTGAGNGGGAPAISGILPPGASSGIRITISGSGFGGSQGGGGVKVTDIDATVDSWSDTEISCTVPEGFSDGMGATVTVINDSGESASSSFEITPPNTYAVMLDSYMDHYPCWSAGGSMIYFSSTRSGGANWDIYRIPATGGTPERVTFDESPDFFPDVDPSTGELAWSSQMRHVNNTEGDYEIFYGFPIGGGQGGAATTAMLTSNVSRDLYPAYASTVYSGYDMVYTWEEVDQNGYYLAWKIMLHTIGPPVELTEGEQPNFSPDGQWVVYNHENNIYKIPSGGGAPVQLTDSGHDFFPHWGSVNDKIVFQRLNGGQFNDIFVMNSDGTDVQPLVSTRNDEYNPSWSPDCTKIVYYALVGGRFDLYVYVVP